MRRALGMSLLITACTPGEPPGASSRPSLPAPVEAGVPVLILPGAEGRAAPTADAATSTRIPTGPDSGAVDLVATDATLPQTAAKPEPAETLTLARANALFEAIVADDPKRAEVFFFPLDAYKQVKDSKSPESDWRGRLLANFARDIHALHRSRPNLHNARFVGLEIPESTAKWVKPGEEYNKLPYFRVFDSQLTYDTEAGARHAILLKSLISWRGHYFVVHLSSIK